MPGMTRRSRLFETLDKRPSRSPAWWSRLVVCVVCCIVLNSLQTRVIAAEAARPNILFVLTDDQRWDALGCMGNSNIRTPHLDELAAEGSIFRNMFCTTSICAISRASFITGQYERRHRINGFGQPLSPEQFQNTFVSRLRAVGYRCGIVGKWGLGGPPPVDQYDYWRGYAGQGRYYETRDKTQPIGVTGGGPHLTGRLGGQAVEFIESNPAGTPFLLQLYTKAAQCQGGEPWPFQPAEQYNSLYSDITIPPAAVSTPEDFAALPTFLQNSEARNRWVIRFETAAKYQRSVKDYYRLVTGVDDVVGRLREVLRKQGLDQNTVIIFTSDNGFYLGEHGLAGKWYMHEESIRLPLLIYDPRLPKGKFVKSIDELVLNIDIAPTICELAGVAVPDVMQGTSLLPLIRGEATDWRDDFLYEHRFRHARIPMSEGVRTKRWKYTRYTSVSPVYEELFDLPTDSHETPNSWRSCVPAGRN